MKRLSFSSFFKKNSSLWAVLLLLFLTISFFTPSFFAGKFPIPADSILGLYHPFRDLEVDGYNPGRFPVKNPPLTDPVLQTYPWRNLIINNIKEGNWPLWNPYSFAGQPLLANIQSAPFQIFNLLFFVLPFKIAWISQIVLLPILTSLFMFLFLKVYRLSTSATIFASFTLPLAGFFMAWLTWGTVTATALWLPLILLAINKLSKNKNHALWFLILALAISQTVFSGHWQTAAYVLASALLYFAYSFYQTRSKAGLVVITWGFLLGITVTSVQTLPAFEFIKHSARDLDQAYYQGRPDWFIPPQNLVQLIAPDFFGNPATYNHWGIWNYAEFVSFLGIIPLTLALFAILKKNSAQNFFLPLAALSLVLGLANPISKLPYTLNIPLVSSAQPSRITFLLVFSLCALSAFGFDYFLRESTKKKLFFPPLAILAILLALLLFVIFQKNLFPLINNLDSSNIALRNLAIPLATAGAFLIIVALKLFKIKSHFLILLIFAATLAELFRFGYKFTPFSKPAWIFPPTEITEFLANQERPFRIMTTDRRIMHPNIAAVYGLESVDGYDPLYLSDYAHYVSVWQSQNPKSSLASFNRIVTPQKYNSRLVDLLNVKYLLTFDEINAPGFEKVLEEGQTKLFRNNSSLPRAFFVEEVIKVTDKPEEYALLLDQNFDLLQKAASLQLDFAKTDIDASAQFQSYSDQQLSIKTSSDNLAPLVLTNIFYPGWQAFIDGQRTDIYEVDAIFQMVLVSKGEHLVEFKFQPQSFYNGLYISQGAVFLILIYTLFLWRRKSQS